MKFDKNNPDHIEWLIDHSADFVISFRSVSRRLRLTARMIDLMHDKPMTQESIDMVIEYIRECGK